MKNNFKNKLSITTIIPVYNEATVIDDAIASVYSVLNINFMNFEIIIVESGSTDGSSIICDKLSEKYSNIKVFHEKCRNGYGSAIKIGINRSTKEVIWIIHPDIPFDLKVIKSAICYFSEYDVILSYRSKDPRSKFRKIQSLVFNKLIKVALGLKIRHINSAFRLFKAIILKNMDLYSNGWFIDAEIIHNLQKNNISFFELPVELIDRKVGHSKISLFTPLTILKELFNYIKLGK